MARYGYHLTVICSKRDYYTDEVMPTAQGKAVHFSREGGMDIINVATFPGAQRSMARRVLFYLSFAIMTLYAGLRVPSMDLVYARTPALLTPVSGWLLARLKGARFVIAIGDLHPDEAVNLGQVKNSLLIRLWEKMENFFRRRADLLVVTVPGIKSLLVAKGFPPDFIHVATNAYDIQEERGDPLPSETVAALDQLQGQFIVMYAGSMGDVHALEVVVAAAKDLQNEFPDIQFALVGKGRKLPDLKSMASAWGLRNLHFLEPVARNCVFTLLNRAQAVAELVYTGEAHGCYYLPNKFFEYLGSGKPIIYSGSGDVADRIRQACCGLVVPPENPKAFAAAVKYLWEHQDEAREMGRRGKTYVMEHFDRKKILQDLMKRLEGLQT
jgi:colanic acid biosynthesis glycosyl transferase WcaI